MTDIPTETSSGKEMENLWNKHDIHQKGHAVKPKVKLREKQLLDRVSVLLHVADQMEENAVMCYLEPLKHGGKIYKHTEQDDAREQKIDYLIGKYGACTVAVTKFKHNAATTAPNFNCFKNLNTIISIGVAYGVENRVEICDVLVAEKIITYQQDGMVSSEKNTSKVLSKIFGRDIEWLDEEIKDHLNKCKINVPAVKKGIISNVPNIESIQQFASNTEALGIEVKTANLSKGAQNVKHMTTVKAVCDFGNDQKKKMFQNVAALLAANFVKKYLDDPEVPEWLLQISDDHETDIVTGTSNLDSEDIKQNLLYLSEELTSEEYKSIQDLLVNKSVITLEEKGEIDEYKEEKQPSKFIDILQKSQDDKLHKNYKLLLQAMEECNNSRLEQRTKNLEQPAYSMEDLGKKYKEAHDRCPTLKVQYHNLTPEQYGILDEVQVMIMVVNDSEFMATMSKLELPKLKEKNEQLPNILEVHCSTEVVCTNKQFIFHIGMFGKCQVAVAKVKPGQGREALYHIKYFPNILLIAAVGVAAGFPENDVHFGDVVISTQIADCSTYKIQNGTFIPRGKISEGCHYMIKVLESKFKWDFECSKKGRKSSVIAGQVLSGPVLLNSIKERKKILNSFGKEAKAYEMEGYSIIGFGIDCIIIKGVCDFASVKTKEWQPTAALAANEYLLHHLKQLDLSIMKKCNKDVSDHDDSPSQKRINVNDHISDSDDYSPSPKRMRSYSGDDFPDYGYSRQGSEESRRSQESRRRSSTSISARKNLNFGSSIHGESNSENQKKSKRRYTEGGYSSMQRFTNERIFHSPISSFELKIFSPINEERRSEAESINITMSSPVIKRRRNSL